MCVMQWSLMITFGLASYDKIRGNFSSNLKLHLIFLDQVHINQTIMPPEIAIIAVEL